AGAVVTQQRDHLATVDVPAHLADRDQPAKAFRQFSDRQQRFHHGLGLGLSRPTSKSRDCAISTATITTVPITMNCQKAETFNITRPVVSTALISPPMTVQTAVPAPPNSLAPPMMTAAIDDRSN